jgi:peptidoglycan L-alanyl-D-glutamate endopeptidase CwlK
MPSRELFDLHPDMAAKAAAFEHECRVRGIDFIFTCTYRSNQEQEELYAQGRTKPGRIVTWAHAGESLHNRVDADGNPASRAFDIVVLRHGKLVWGTGGNGIDNDPTDDDTDDLELWQRAGAVGKYVGLEWAGDWPKNKREFPHFQLPEV